MVGGLTRSLTYLLLLAALLLSGPPAQAAPPSIRVIDANWYDAARQRDIPIRLYLPASRSAPLPLVLFSHGLAGSRAAGEHWLSYWAEHGIAGLAMQHHGSDTDILRGGNLRQAMQAAKSVKQGDARQADARFVLDELARRQGKDANLPAIDLRRIGFAGHSFGAVTTQMLAGQARPLGQAQPEPRLRAFIALSPSAHSEQPALLHQQFGGIHAPFFSITGTADQSQAAPDVTPRHRTLPYQSMPAPDKYLLVLADATHAQLSGSGAGARRPGALEATPGQRQAIETLTLAFWQTYLNGAPASTLRQARPPALGPLDHWEYK